MGRRTNAAGHNLAGQICRSGGAWYGQGSYRVRPMGRTFTFSNGPDLDDALQPWVVDEGRPPEHQFRGYSLDRQRRPTFRYQYADIEVEDFSSQGDTSIPETKRILRTVTLNAATERSKLSFRLTSGKGISDDGDGTFSIRKEIQIRIISDHQAELIESIDGQQLRIPIDVSAHETQKLVLEYLWQ